jgi:hypothetical protein
MYLFEGRNLLGYDMIWVPLNIISKFFEVKAKKGNTVKIKTHEAEWSTLSVINFSVVCGFLGYIQFFMTI